MHARGVIHGDIKPANMGLRVSKDLKSAEVLFMDFDASSVGETEYLHKTSTIFVSISRMQGERMCF